MTRQEKWGCAAVGLVMLSAGLLTVGPPKPQESRDGPKVVEAQSLVRAPVKPASTSRGQDCENHDRSEDRAECRFFKSLPLDSVAAAQAINDRYAEQELELHYWIREGVLESERIGLDLREGPCGPYAMARSRLTTPPDRRLEADEIVEVDSAGNVLRKWPVPESFLWSVVENEVLLRYGTGDRDDLVLAVAIDGHYRVVPGGTIARAEMVNHRVKDGFTCPPYRGFGDSAYAVCSIVREPEKAVRYFIWQAPCT